MTGFSRRGGTRLPVVDAYNLGDAHKKRVELADWAA
jgi:hypothetical protein